MSFENLGIDFEKILRFWVDYQGKYFYFETKPETDNIIIEVSKLETIEKEAISNIMNIYNPKARDVKTIDDSLILGIKSFYKIIGKIDKVPNFPPSLHLKEVTTKKMMWDYENNEYVPHDEEERRDNYGLMLDRLAYYEEIGDTEKLQDFLDSERF